VPASLAEDAGKNVARTIAEELVSVSTTIAGDDGRVEGIVDNAFTTRRD